MAAFAAWLMGAVRIFLTWAYNNAIDLCQGALDGFVDFAVTVLALFPSGASMPGLPPVPQGSVWVEFLHALNWFFPISLLISVLGVVVTGMLAYLIVAPIARWVKLLT